MKRVLASTAVLCLLLTGTAAGQLSGVYHVGGDSPDFATPQEAADSLISQGVSGPVDMLIRPGLYEAGTDGDGPVLVIDRGIPGASAASRVTFGPDASAGGSSTNVVLQRRLGGTVISMANAPFQTPASHVTIRDLTALTEDTVAGQAELQPVVVVGGTFGGVRTTDVQIVGLTIDGSQRRAPGIKVAECGSDIQLVRNRISATSYAMDVFCPNPVRLRVLDNHVEQSGYNGGGANLVYVTVVRVRTNATSDVHLIDNVVDMTGRCSHSAIGVNGPISGLRVERNHVIDHRCGGGDGTRSGGSISVEGGTGKTVVANNMVSLGTNGSLFQNGGPAMSLSQSADTMLVAHNSTYSFRKAAGPTINAQAAAAFARIFNNVFVVSLNTDAMSALGTVERDYNVLSNGTGLGPNSFVATPEWENPERDLHMGECAFEQSDYFGLMGLGVANDIDLEGRDPLNPFRGADEPKGSPPMVFDGPTTFESGASSFLMASGDLDGDGDIDIAVTNVQAGAGGNDVTLLFNDGSGTLGSPVHLPFGTDPTHIEIGLMNADAFPDIVVIAAEGVFQRLGLGGGAFAPPTQVAPASAFTDLELADYDGDGDVDILTLDSPPADSAVVVAWVNDGPGTYTFPNAYTVAKLADDLELADLDDDGFPDLLLVDNTDTHQLYTARNLGASVVGVSDGFDEPTAYPLGVESVPAASQFMIADFDGDLDLDIVLGDAATDNLILVRNNGDGTLAEGEPIEVDSRGAPRVATSLDYEGDGDPDLVVASSVAMVDLFRNDGDGHFDRFALCSSGAVSGFPNAILAAPLDGDASPDVAVLTTADSVDVLTNLNWVSGVAIEDREMVEPTRTGLSQNYPNPFSLTTSVPYVVTEPGPVSLVVYDILGREVRSIRYDTRTAGSHVEVIDATGLASGVYFYRMIAGRTVDTRQMVVRR